MKKIKVNADIYVGEDKLATLKDVTDNIAKSVVEYLTENQHILNKNGFYNTVEDMKSDEKLTEGSIAITSGYYSSGDGGGAKYIIKSQLNNFNHFETLSNGLYASLIIEGENIYPRQWGAHFNGYYKGDDNKFYKNSSKTQLADDDTEVIKEILNKMNNRNDPKPVSILIDGPCTLSESLNVVSSVCFRGTSIGIYDRGSRRGSFSTNLDSLDSFLHHNATTLDGSDLHSFVVEDIEFIGYRTKHAIDFTGFGEVSEINRCKFNDFTDAAIYSTKGGTLTTLNHCSLFRNKIAVSILGSSQWVINECGGDYNEIFFNLGNGAEQGIDRNTINVNIISFKSENNTYPIVLSCNNQSIITFSNGRWDGRNTYTKCIMKTIFDVSQLPTIMLDGRHSQTTPILIDSSDNEIIPKKSNVIKYYNINGDFCTDLFYRKGVLCRVNTSALPYICNSSTAYMHNAFEDVILTGSSANVTFVNDSKNKVYNLINTSDVQKTLKIRGNFYILPGKTTSVYSVEDDGSTVYTTMETKTS